MSFWLRFGFEPRIMFQKPASSTRKTGGHQQRCVRVSSGRRGIAQACLHGSHGGGIVGQPMHDWLLSATP